MRGEPAPERAPWTGDRAEHTIATTVTGLAVGARARDAGHELAELGVGLFLRDMGKLALPPRLVAKRPR